jgi:superfamily II DNA or RNA helicase
VDEVHHIAAEVFSQALFTVVTRNTLGLSATMNRKDGTSHVFKWFLGPVVYTSPRDGEHQVLVRRVYYRSDDAEFNTVVRNYRDEVQFSTMISKLCTHAPRTEFILNTLVQLIRDHEQTIHGCCSGGTLTNTATTTNGATNGAASMTVNATTTTNKDHWRQIMVIAQNRNVLNFMHKWLKHNHPEISVGFYVGGMKEADLKQTELCQVVLATYAMAAEALDIPTLSVLFMVTPKTDIVQSIGRILRVRRTGLMQPMVYDFIDPHDLFKRQAKVRNTYYRKQGYYVETFSPKVGEVITCDTTDDLNGDDWDNDGNSWDSDHESTSTNSVPVEAPKCLITIKRKPA